MIVLLVLLIIVIVIIWLCIKQIKRNMQQYHRTLAEEIAFELNSQNSSKRKRNNGWRYRSDIVGTAPVSLPDAEPLVIPAGDYEQRVYTYDGRPLKGTRKGSRFTLDVVPGYQTMVSVYTGTEWSSYASVAYKNHLIGHIGDSLYKERIQMLMLKYPYVRVHARRDGTDAGGWPYITLTLPPLSWFDSVIEG